MVRMVRVVEGNVCLLDISFFWEFFMHRTGSFFVSYSMAGVEVGMAKVNGYTTRNVMSFACEFLVFVLTHRCGTQLSSEERHHD
jgi:hypothetical protein